MLRRAAMAFTLGFVVILIAGIGGSVVGQDKKDEKKKLEGTLTCTKCALSETKACGHALIVKQGDKKVKYYLVDKGGKEPYHKECCQADVAAIVTGKVVEKDKKLLIENPKVEIKK
ncbi:MAG: DUF6370 family protein [Planctomycetia bacterium]|nr:DUF6370 family protein [Planctomycetia bacterium]